MQSRASYRATARPVEYHLEARRQMQQRIAEVRRTAAAGPGAPTPARSH